MGPSSGENKPQFNLPPQSQEQEASIDNAREQLHEVEKAGENKVGKQQPQLTPPPQTTTTQTTAQLPVVQPTAVTPDPIPTQTLTAQDVDLIEKQWVHKTKEVLNKTKDDPFKQKNEVSRIKADYVKKRFNKELPVEGSKTGQAGSTVKA